MKAGISMLATAGCMLVGTAAFAQTNVPVQTVEGWSIARDIERGGCVMEKINEDGYLVRIGKTEAGSEFGYIAVYTRDEDVNVIGV